jgi:murein DD-endopeptidase MepM/ murein hydrolase activator NlpD
MRKLVVGVLGILLLTACASNTAEPIASPTNQITLEVKPTEPLETIPPPTATGTPTTIVQIIGSPTPTSDSTTIPSLQLCSPLEIHPLEELPKIIGDPYDPPRPGREERHHGTDFGYYHYQDRDSMLGEPVQSILPGTAASVLDGQYPYGNMLIVESTRSDLPGDLLDKMEIPEDQSLYVLYAHLDQPPMVALGERVVACQELGVVGMSGNTDIPHLHIEIRLGPAGQVFESMRFYDTSATQAELDTYVLWRTSGIFQHFDPLVIVGSEMLPKETPQATLEKNP